MPKKKPHSLWIPKLKPCAVQCASCPFRDGNHAEWGEVVAKLRKVAGIPGKPCKMDLAYARFEIHREVKEKGDFHCHSTVYDKDMKVKPVSEHRQCPGATEYHLKQKEKT